MAANAAGYSGTPLLKKLGYDKGGRALLVGVHRGPAELLAFQGFGYRETAPDVSAAADGAFDLVHVFVTLREELDLNRLRGALAPAGALWVSWPKKASRMPTDLDENVLRAAALAADLVDVKVCAVDQVWSGLKLVIPRALR